MKTSTKIKKCNISETRFVKAAFLYSGGRKFSQRMTSQYLISRDKMFHSQLAFLKTCSMLFVQVKSGSNLLIKLLITRTTFTAGLENQLEVNFARARRSSLHLPIKRLGWDNYLCRRPNIDFKHKGRILQRIKDNPYKKHPTSNRIGNGQVSKTIYMLPRISLKPTH